MATTVDHVSLYRRFRPQRFGEVIGQDHVTTALKNAVASGRVSHLYLFSGPRGTGKTSTARILAKALNCSSVVDGEPCCECPSCVSVLEGRSFDVEELDAASNSGVDSIRSLISTVANASIGEWKVYIIDEVHMLSNSAASALLKTLEEPPARVVFVLATTDPQKVLSTIRSRAQHFEFKLLQPKLLEDLAKSVSLAAGIDLGEDAFEWVVKRGSGSARDTLSFLDQVAALGGVPGGSAGSIPKLAASIIGLEAETAFELTIKLTEDGYDPQRILEELMSVSKDAFVVVAGGKGDSELISEVAKSGHGPINLASIVRFVQGLARIAPSLKDAIDPTLILQASLLALCAPPQGGTGDGRRISALEAKLAKLEGELAEWRNGDSTSKPSEIRPSEIRPSERAAGNNPSAMADSAFEGGKESRPLRTEVAQTSALGEVRPPSGDQLAGIRAGMKVTRPRDGRVQGEMPTVRAEPASGQTVAKEVHEPQGLLAHGLPPEATNEDSKPGKIGELDSLSKLEAKIGSIFNRDRLAASFNDEILTKVSHKARARFVAGRCLSVVGDQVVIVLPNKVHRDRCAEFLTEVEQAIKAHFSLSEVRVVLKAEEEVAGTEEAPPDLADEEQESYIDLSVPAESTADGLKAVIESVFPGTREIAQKGI